jgi:DNA-binding response OmpR family regulator
MVGVMGNTLRLRFGDLTIDLERYRVLLSGRPLILSYREYALLTYLAGRSGQLVHKRQLLEEGLGRHDPGGLRMVEEHIRHLKSVLEHEGHAFIEEVDGSGYRFEASSVPQPGSSL